MHFSTKTNAGAHVQNQPQFLSLPWIQLEFNVKLKKQCMHKVKFVFLDFTWDSLKFNIQLKTKKPIKTEVDYSIIYPNRFIQYFLNVIFRLP